MYSRSMMSPIDTKNKATKSTLNDNRLSDIQRVARVAEISIPATKAPSASEIPRNPVR